MRKFLSNLIIFTLLALLISPQLSVYSEEYDKKDYKSALSALMNNKIVNSWKFKQ